MDGVCDVRGCEPDQRSQRGVNLLETVTLRRIFLQLEIGNKSNEDLSE